jgi:hypothetical protein
MIMKKHVLLTTAIALSLMEFASARMEDDQDDFALHELKSSLRVVIDTDNLVFNLARAGSASIHNSDNALTFNTSTTGSFSGVLSGPGSLTRTGAGTLTLTGVEGTRESVMLSLLATTYPRLTVERN